MDRNTFIYKISKKCENPMSKGIWAFLRFFWLLIVVVYGECIYKAIRKEFKTAKILYNCAVSTGDYYVLSTCFEKLKEAAGFGEDYVLVVPNNLKSLCKALSFNVYPLSDIAFNSLNMYFAFIRFSDQNTLNFACWLFYKANEYCLKKLELINPFAYQDNMKIKEFENDGIFHNKKVVILSPYEQTLTHRGCQLMPVDFWIKLSNLLKEKGYEVCTNCKNTEQEPCIEGTIAVLPKFSEIGRFFELAGTCVSTRSGLTDLIAMTKSKKIVLYPTETALNNLSLCDYFGHDLGIVELEYSKYLDRIDEFVDIVIKEILEDDFN